jgi:hypothetical protein
MRRLPVLYARSYLYGIIAASFAYQFMFASIGWFMTMLVGFGLISFVGIFMLDYDVKHNALALANALLLWQVVAVLMPSTFIWNEDHIHQLSRTQYLPHSLNLNPIPIPTLQNLVKKVGIDSYGGELVSREVIQQHYKIPMYLYQALVKQAQYTNELQKLNLISGMPLGMTRFNLPSAADVQKTERVSANEYLELNRSPHRDFETSTSYQRYTQRMKWLIQLCNSNYLLPKLTVKQVQSFRALLKQYKVPISVRAMFTHYLGRNSMVNLYHKDMNRENQATECQRTLGFNNPECGKVAGVVTYFIRHDDYHKS